MSNKPTTNINLTPLLPSMPLTNVNENSGDFSGDAWRLSDSGKNNFKIMNLIFLLTKHKKETLQQCHVIENNSSLNISLCYVGNAFMQINM